MDKSARSNTDNDDKQKSLSDWKKHKVGIGCLTLFFLPILLVGLGSFFVATYQFYKVYEAKKWKPTNATILFSDLSVSRGVKGGLLSEVKIKYEYFIGTKSFIGNSVSFGMQKNSSDGYGLLYDKLNNSKVVQVYVNENDPEESVLIRDVTNSMIVLVIFSFMWNSLLMVFVLPIFFKKLTPSKILVFTIIIWFLGMGKLIYRIGDIDISKRVVVLEEKEEYIYIE